MAKPELGGAAHPALDRADGPLGIEQELVARFLADEQFPVLGETDHRGQDDVSLLVAEQLRVTIPVDGDFRVGGAEVDAEDLVRHYRSPLLASPLLTITSAVRNTWSSQRKPARTSSITVPSATALSAAVPMARASRGSNGKPANWVATTRRSSRISSRRRNVLRNPSCQPATPDRSRRHSRSRRPGPAPAARRGPATTPAPRP